MNHQNKSIDLPLLPKIPKEQLEDLIQSYMVYANRVKYIYYFILGLFAIILIYNLAFAGKSYSISEYNTIRDTMVGVVLVFLLVFMVYGGYVIAQFLKLKKKVNKAAEKNKLDKKTLRKEFHLLVKATIGGPGLR